MSDAKHDDELTAEESQALLNSLNARAAGGAAPAAEDDGGDEDLEAYLASLEGDDAPAAKPAQAAKPAEPDPFADAFSQLEAEHGHAVTAPPPREIKAPEAKKPAEKAPEAKKPAEKAPEAKKPAEKAAEKPAEKTPEAKKPEAAKSRVHAVEKVRSRQFILVTGAIKLALLLAPALLTWWIAGALLSRWVGTGWIVVVVATLIAFVPGIALKLGTHKGRALWWMCGVGVLLSAAAIAGLPQHTGQALIRYGHWPSSTIAQLAQWDADHLVVRGHASASALAGEQVLKIRAEQAAPAAAPDAAKPAALVPLALGTEQDLKAFADEARKKAAEAAKPAEAPTKPADPAAPAKPAEAPVKPAEAAKPAEAPPATP